jgi:hypothetical protein
MYSVVDIELSLNDSFNPSNEYLDISGSPYTITDLLPVIFYRITPYHSICITRFNGGV